MKDLKNTIWKLNEGVNREFQITFLKGGFFEYSKDGKKIGGLDSKWTWKQDGKSITLSFNDGFQINSGEINSDFNNIQGTFKSEWGDKGEWSAVYEKEAELNLNKSVSNSEIGTHGVKTLTFDELMITIFGEDDYPDYGTPANDIRGSEFLLNVPIEAAEEIANTLGYELNDEWVDDNGDIKLPAETEVEFKITTEDVIDNSDDLKADFLCNFTEMGEDICDGEIDSSDLEEWINNRLQCCVDYFNNFTVIGTWGSDVSEEESEKAIFCEIKLEKTYKLSDLNPDWTDEKYILEGFDEIERDNRIDTFIYW